MFGGIVLYRGPLQRSRLSLLAECAARRYGPLRLVWISPRPVTQRRVEHFQEFVRLNPWLEDWEIVDGRMGAFPTAVRRLREAVPQPSLPVLAVGFTSLFYARRLATGPLIWCINGIPEERLLTRGRALDRGMVRALWLAARLGRAPDLVVTVSSRMSRLVRERCGDLPAIAVPNCPLEDLFAAPDDPPPRRFLTYLGTAAPWQQVEYLAELWAELHRQDPGLRFRVISRDRGCDVLREGLSEDSVQFLAADDPRQVGRWLAEARVGFLLRAPHVVNQVSFPLKFGEYLAAGAPVIASDLDWDPADIVRDTECGVLIPVGEPRERVAARIREFLARPDHSALAAAGSARLRRAEHVEGVVQRLPGDEG